MQRTFLATKKEDDAEAKQLEAFDMAAILGDAIQHFKMITQGLCLSCDFPNAHLCLEHLKGLSAVKA